MAKATMLSFTKDYLKQHAKNLGVAIDVDKAMHTMTIIGEVSVENTLDIQLNDEVDNEINDDMIYFEDAIVFYDEQVAIPDEDEYLAAFAIDYDTGIDEGVLQSILQQFIRILKKGDEAILAFLEDTEAEEFAFVWDEIDVEKYATGKMLPFPKYGA